MLTQLLTSSTVPRCRIHSGRFTDAEAMFSVGSVCSEFPVYSAEDGGLRKLHQISLLIDLRYLWQWPGAVAPLRRGLRQARGFRLPDITQVPDILLGKMRWPCDGIQHCTPP